MDYFTCMHGVVYFVYTSDLFNDQGTTTEYLSMLEAGCVLNFRSCTKSYCICIREKSYFCQWSNSKDCLPGFQLARGRCKDCEHGYMVAYMC